MGVTQREIPVGGRVLFAAPIYNGSDEDWGPLTGDLSDQGVAAWRELSPTSGVVEARTPGTSQMTVTGTRMKASVQIAVLDTSDAPSPIVVDDFHVIEVQDADEFAYAPRIVLRDTSGAAESAVIGIWFEIPQEGRTPRCAALRPVGSGSTEILRDYYGRFEVMLPVTARRITTDQPVIAHLTLRVPGPFAKEVTLAGRIVPGDWPANRSLSNDDVMSCG
jgi:hypothetical protein